MQFFVFKIIFCNRSLLLKALEKNFKSLNLVNTRKNNTLFNIQITNQDLAFNVLL